MGEDVTLERSAKDREDELDDPSPVIAGAGREAQPGLQFGGCGEAAKEARVVASIATQMLERSDQGAPGARGVHPAERAGRLGAAERGCSEQRPQRCAMVTLAEQRHRFGSNPEIAVPGEASKITP
jgi:hypothetical protein